MPLKLLNINEIIPKEFYIFIAFNNVMTAHNLKITQSFVSSAFGQIFEDKEFLAKYLSGSARYLPYEPCTNKLDCHSISPYCMTAINGYRIEMELPIPNTREIYTREILSPQHPIFEYLIDGKLVLKNN